ncbi:MAG: sulfotransferase family 2 domain-containing protein [Cyanobacteria bacterium P01_F01_bin.150]
MVMDRTGIYRLQDGEQMCFIHIPKTAGTTMSAILESRFDHQKICPTPYWRNLRVMKKREMKPYRLFRGHFPYDVADIIPGTPVCITMLRDPIERVISAYEFMKTCVIVYPAARKVQEKARTLSLKDYVRDPDVNGVINAQTRMIAGRDCQSKKIDQRDPIALEIAKENLQQFAFVGVTEQFWDSMGLLSYQFGWTPPREIQRLMVGKKKLRRENLSQDVIDIITEYNLLDIEFYDYSKALFEAQHAKMVSHLQEEYGTSANKETGTESESEVSTEELRSLLEKHYESCFAQQQEENRVTKRLTFTFDQAVPGNGWHRLEGLERNEPFRWTGPRTESSLDFPLDLSDDLAMEFRILNSTTPDILKSLKVFANDQPLKLVPLHRDASGAMFRSTIPKEVAEVHKPFTRLSFAIDKTIPFNKVALGSDDKRPVGLAMNLVQCFPVNSRPEVDLIDSPIDSQPWFNAIAFLKEHLQPDQTLFAPNTFRLVFADQIPYEEFAQIDLTINYVSRTLNLASANKATAKRRTYDWVVLHKGVNDDYVGGLLFQVLKLGLKPVFANPVFTIFTTKTNVNAQSIDILSYGNQDVRSVFTRYIKHQFSLLINGKRHKKNIKKFLQKIQYALTES